MNINYRLEEPIMEMLYGATRRCH